MSPGVTTAFYEEKPVFQRPRDKLRDNRRRRAQGDHGSSRPPEQQERERVETLYVGAGLSVFGLAVLVFFLDFLFYVGFWRCFTPGAVFGGLRALSAEPFRRVCAMPVIGGSKHIASMLGQGTLLLQRTRDLGGDAPPSSSPPPSRPSPHKARAEARPTRIQTPSPGCSRGAATPAAVNSSFHFREVVGVVLHTTTWAGPRARGCPRRGACTHQHRRAAWRSSRPRRRPRTAGAPTRRRRWPGLLLR